MLTRRGLAVLAGGALMWLGARVAGSPELHIVSVGLVLLSPLAALGVWWRRPDVRVGRRPASRRAHAGSRLRVDLEVRNLGRSRTPVLMLEDRLPVELGRAARAVLSGVEPRARQRVSYEVRCARRGRFAIGPLTVGVRDPFGLAERRLEFPEEHPLIVYPEVEDLRSQATGSSAGGTGERAARRMVHAGDEFYTLRAYQTGDDLRRIHWPSTARTGRLMIRQQERGRRASATILLDTRAPSGPGATRAFERAVSGAASVGALLMRDGVDVRLATADAPPARVGLEGLLERLALVEPAPVRGLLPALTALRREAVAGETLVVVTHPMAVEEAALLGEATEGYGRRLALVVRPPRERPSGPSAEATRAALERGGWETVVVPADGRLREAWTRRGTRQAIRTGARS